MTPAALRRRLRQKERTYDELAGSCSSVPELLLRIEVYGESWTRWDWALFTCRAAWTAPELVSDMLKELDGGSSLDFVFRDKAVVLGLVGVASANGGGRSSGMPPTAIVAAAGLLGHAFRKFPSMWNMNWMFARVKGGGRVHRMSWAADGYDEYVETWGGWGSGPDEGPA